MSFKVTLETSAADLVKEMVGHLKAENSGVSITPSDLTSWIVTQFKKKTFEKSKQAIVDAHFNPKAYLREKLRTAQTKEDISLVMEEIQRRLHPFKPRKKKTTPV